MSISKISHSLAIERCRANLAQLAALYYCCEAFPPGQREPVERLIFNLSEDIALLENSGAV